MITKRLIQLLITLFLIAVLAVVGLMLFVDPNRYKDVIIKKVENTFDRQLAINGDISWRFWPRLGFNINGVILGQAPGFANDHNNVFAQVGEASIYIRLAPLLNKQLLVDKLSLKDADFYLARLADGTTNWDDLSNARKKSDAKNTSDTTKSAELNWAVNALTIENTYLIWNDEQKKQKITLDIDDLNTSMQAGHASPLDAILKIDMQPQNIQLNANIDTQYYFDTPNRSYGAEHGQIKLEVLGLKGLEQAQNINVNFDKFAVDLVQDQIVMDNIRAHLFGGDVFINAKGDHFSKTPQLHGNVSIKNINPQLLSQAFGHELRLADETAAKQLNLEATFNNTADGFTMQPFSAQLDDTKITGSLSANSSKPHFKFDLNVNQINLDRYLPSNSRTQAADMTSNAKTQKTNATNDGMRNLSAKGKLYVDNMLLSGINLRSLDVQLDAQDGIMHISPVKAQLYDGTFNSTTVLNMQKATPIWNIDARLNNIDMGALLKEMAKNDKFTGRLNLQTKVTAEGLDSQSMMRTMNGNAKFNIDNGVLNNIDLGYWLAVGESMVVSAKNLSTLAVTTAEAAAGKTNTKHTAFNEMSGTFSINQGVAQNNDLLLYSETFYTSGKGQIDLNKQFVDYALRVSNAQHTGGVYQPSGIQIPLKVSGPFKDPHVSIDAAGIQSLLVQAVQDNLKNTLKDAINPVGTADSVEQTIVNTITGNNSGANTTNTNTNPPPPEQVVKDALKGLLGK